jgi:hypothetical protein
MKGAYRAIVRRRIVIGAITAGVIGVGAYVFSPPKERTVEWHKEQYGKANTKTPVTQLMKLGVVPRTIRQGYFRRAEERAALHWQALVDAGYLSQRVVAVSNHPVLPRLWKDISDTFTNDTLTFTTIRRTNFNLTVTAPAEAIDRIEEIIRKDDASQSAKRR